MSETLRRLSEFPAMDEQFIEAIGMEMERARRANYLGFGEATPAEVAQQMYAGEGELFNSMKNILHHGNPQSKFEKPVARDMQDRLLEGYTGLGWLPSQVEELGRTPEPKEMSPGAKMAHELNARRNFILSRDLDAYEKSKTFDPRTWVEGGDPFERLSILKDYGLQALQDANNPETPLGTFMTKFGQVFSDAASHAGDALLGYGDIENSVGDAFVRSNGADWNRMYPMLTDEGDDWRSRDALIEQGKRAFAESEGMDANEFLQSFFNNAGLEYYPNPISNMTAGTAVTVGNGFFDGTYGGPAQQMLEELGTDGGLTGVLNVMNEFPKAFDSNEYMNARPSIEENQQARMDDKAQQQQAIKTLESIDGQVRHPQQEMFDKAKSVAAKAVSSYRAPLGNAIPW